MTMTPDITSTHATARVTWSLDAEITPGSVPDRPVPYNRSNAVYRPSRFRLTFSVLGSGVQLRPFSLASARMNTEMRESVKIDGVALYGPRLKADGTPGTHEVREPFYGLVTEAPDWLQDIAGKALAELVNPA